MLVIQCIKEGPLRLEINQMAYYLKRSIMEDSGAKIAVSEPGNSWYACFLARRSAEIMAVEKQNTTRARIVAVNPHAIGNQTGRMRQMLTFLNIKNGAQFGNLDETVVSVNHRKDVIVVARGSKAWSEKWRDNVNMSILPLVFATKGKSGCPFLFVIYKANRHANGDLTIWTRFDQKENLHYHTDVFCAYSKSGCLTKALWEAMLPVMLRKFRSLVRVLGGNILIVRDNLGAHLSDRVDDELKSIGVHFFDLNPNVSAVSNALDQAPMFGALKNLVAKSARGLQRVLRIVGLPVVLTRHSVFLSSALTVLNNGSAREEAFRVIGHWPLSIAQAEQNVKAILGRNERRDISNIAMSRETEERYTKSYSAAILDSVRPALMSAPLVKLRVNISQQKRMGLIMDGNIGKRKRTPGPKGRPPRNREDQDWYNHFPKVTVCDKVKCVNCEAAGQSARQQYTCDKCNAIRICSTCYKSVSGRNAGNSHYDRCLGMPVDDKNMQNSSNTVFDASEWTSSPQ